MSKADIATASIAAGQLQSGSIGRWVEFGAVQNHNNGGVPIKVYGLLVGVDHVLGSTALHVAGGPDEGGFETFPVNPLNRVHVSPDGPEEGRP
ncbi:hypothetical protein SEA_LILBEANIE_96 [Gordonia phage Lilbeanie]|uniref:Uncharacterized protein n=1 Tax=Gordonia phage Lilbeanie TaxID=2794947 RepID=A0A7T1KSD6_9CAUD|nr:hypothetical protein J1773_gp96 [Gordonia phage Lilbeanie]QPO17174.1 hypothetical protein SEA_LILBEANIE_96 [Gordonia phage Lilbeanie]